MPNNKKNFPSSPPQALRYVYLDKESQIKHSLWITSFNDDGKNNHLPGNDSIERAALWAKAMFTFMNNIRIEATDNLLIGREERGYKGVNIGTKIYTVATINKGKITYAENPRKTP